MSEYLVFDNETLTGAIVAEDLSVLRAVTYRGKNEPVPYVPGAARHPRWLDELDETLVFSVTGRFDPDGDPHSDREVGLEQNLEHYRALFTSGGDVGTSAHDVELHYAGSVFTGEMQIDQYAAVRTGPETGRIVVRFTLADGELVEGS